VPTLLATHTAATSTQSLLNSPCLRTWLRDDWAILFSHPDDFVSYDFEMDRWLVIMRRAFTERNIRPLALASPTREVDMSWVTQVSGDERTVLLEDPQQYFGPVDLQTPVLRESIEQSQQRFVMIIDNTLRIQKMFAYRSRADLPSPLELLGWADTLRSKQASHRHPPALRDLSPHTPRPASYLPARIACTRRPRAHNSAMHSWAAAAN
jgi:alkyl hydroperoxide reductase subunit AhpC